MCEPVSCAIAGIALVCCCCIGIAMMASLAAALGPIMGAVLEVMQCVNETIGPTIEKASKEADGNCAKWKDLGCEEKMNQAAQQAQQNDQGPVAITRRLAEDSDLQECKTLSAKCFCDVAEELTKMDPPVGGELNKCCNTLTDSESNPMLGEMATQAAEMCLGIATNLTDGLEEVNKNCSKGQLPNGGAFDSLVGHLQGGDPGGASTIDPDGFSQFYNINSDRLIKHFNRIDAAWQPGTAVQPVAAFGGGVIVLAAISLVLRRKFRAPTLRSPLVEAEME